MEIYKWVPLDRKRHLRAPLSAAVSGTTTPISGGNKTGGGTVDSSNVTSKAPSTGYEKMEGTEETFSYEYIYHKSITYL